MSRNKCLNSKEYKNAKKEMLGNSYFAYLKILSGKCLAIITWKINRFANKPHNLKDVNYRYFQIHANEIESIISFLEDDLSKETYKKILRYREFHKIKDQPIYNKKNQYFPRDIVRLGEDEVFVDCGAYIGDTIRTFKRYSKNRYAKIVAFEPSTTNLNKIEKNDNRVHVINKGAWNCTETVHFIEQGDESVIVDSNDKNAITIQCTSIDECKECDDATFIKMDIEGAELRALKGAKKTITNNHPKLAICIYHSPEDMVEIPLYLKENYPFYKFYVRHHSHRCAETVFYAIP